MVGRILKQCEAVTRRRRPVRRTVALACALLACPSAGASAAAEEGGDTEVTRVNGTNAAAPAPARAAYGEQTTSGAGDPGATGGRSGAGQASGTRQGSVIDETSVTDVLGGW